MLTVAKLDGRVHGTYIQTSYICMCRRTDKKPKNKQTKRQCDLLVCRYRWVNSLNYCFNSLLLNKATSGPSMGQRSVSCCKCLKLALMT